MKRLTRPSRIRYLRGSSTWHENLGFGFPLGWCLRLVVGESPRKPAGDFLPGEEWANEGISKRCMLIRAQVTLPGPVAHRVGAGRPDDIRSSNSADFLGIHRNWPRTERHLYYR